MKQAYKSSNWNKYQTSNLLKKLAIKNYYHNLRKTIPIKDKNKYRILDAGCGEGFTIKYLKDFFPEVSYFGIDINNVALKQAEEVIKPQVNLVQAFVEEIPYGNNFFDFTICLEVLEHLKTPEIALRELQRVTKELLIISVPNEPIFEFLRFLSGHNFKKFGVCSEHFHRWSRKEFISFLTNNKLKIIKSVTPFPFVWNIFLVKI